MKKLTFLTLALSAALQLHAASDDGFENIFNGTDLTGWKPTGKADVWGAEKGVRTCPKGKVPGGPSTAPRAIFDTPRWTQTLLGSYVPASRGTRCCHG